MYMLKISKNKGGVKALQDYFLKTIVILHFNSIQAFEIEGVIFAFLFAMLNLKLIFFKELKRR